MRPYRASEVHTLRRLGSRVRILSPAPDFLEKISDIERSFEAVFCFPALACRAGEAAGSRLQRAHSRLWHGQGPGSDVTAAPSNTRASYLTRPTFR